jgi:TolB-like protein
MRVAVLEFSSASSDPALAPLGKGLQSMITTDLASVSALKVVERERLKDVQGELKLSRGQGFDKATAAKIGKLAGASHLLVGGFTVVGETMRLDGRLLVVATSEVLTAEQVSGEKALFFELEQKLVQKVIDALGVKPAPKERALLQRAHTADFQAFSKFSDGIQAFDDGRLEEAMTALNQAAAIDADFKLATLTLAEYERLAAQVRAKADAAGRVEDEMARLEKNKAIAAEAGVMRKLWPIVDGKGGNLDAKVHRVAATCLLAQHYRHKLGYENRGPINHEDLAEAGFDDFSSHRTADALFARAWAEAPDVFPRLPPLCLGLGMISSDSKYSLDELIGFHVKDAAKLADNREALLSYISNNATVDPAAEWLQLDQRGRVKLWQRLYTLAEKLPGITDDERARFEVELAEDRRAAGDIDGSTQMYAAASRHSKDSYKLKELSKEIEENKTRKQILDSGPAGLRELFLMNPRIHVSELQRLAEPSMAKSLADRVQSARALHQRSMLIVGDVPMWPLESASFGGFLATGPRTADIRSDEIRYEGWESSSRSERPRLWMLSSAVRGRRMSLRASIDRTMPADWKSRSKGPLGAASAGIAFAMARVAPEGGIDKKKPTRTIAYAVMLVGDRVRLLQLTRDGEHNLGEQVLGEADVGTGRGKRHMEIKVEAQNVAVIVDGKRVSFPYKPAGDTDGFAGIVFQDPGYAAVSGLSFKAERGK